MKKPAPHPGEYVRGRVLPDGMSVTEAAKLLGVGRPALSNFLNGNSSLSNDMAVRLEKAFGADRNQLLEMQSAFDGKEQEEVERSIAVRRAVPGFLAIRARQVAQWAEDHIDARTHLPVLLRKLVQATGTNLAKVDFPGYDNAERRGSDGVVEAGAANPWIPLGCSYWEFGTNRDVARKAEGDYRSRLGSVPIEKRRAGTFVFVTPREWAGKEEWRRQKNEKADWKEVRVYDASDLEQWLEQSIPVQTWFAGQVGVPTEGVRTLEDAWHQWAKPCDPPLSPALFAPSLEAAVPALQQWLDGSAGALPFTADSRAEALAFLKCLFDKEELEYHRDRVAIFTSAETLRRLLTPTADFLPILDTQEIERELAADLVQRHYLVFQPRNASAKPAGLSVAPPDHHSFDEALEVLGFDAEERRRLARESGRSLTVLRRRISQVQALRTPPWAEDEQTAEEFSPIVWVGAWNSRRKADQEIISFLGDRPYEEIESMFNRLLRQDDSPVWSAASHRGVVSKIDALFGISSWISSGHLERFFEAAENVLLEANPSLELPEEERWLAALHRKERGHSDAIRDGIFETLVILSVHGATLLRGHLDTELQGRVGHLIRKLLTPLSLEKLLSQDLPRLAEAAPEVFLETVESDLRSNDPVVLELLQPASGDSLFSSPRYTGLLWALECLAWSRQTFSRAALILADLSQKEFDDNWANKPIGSLRAILRSWWPQTAASVEERIDVLRTIADRYPEVGWRIAVEQVRPAFRSGTATYKPRWRRVASGVGNVASPPDKLQFERAALDLLLDWTVYNEKKLGDLVDCLQRMASDERSGLWKLIDEWNLGASEPERTELRERLQQFAAGSRVEGLGDELVREIQEVWYRLQPTDLVFRYRWLFGSEWLTELPFEPLEEAADVERHRREVARMRREALEEIWSVRGFEGVRDLLDAEAAAPVVGRCVADHLQDLESQIHFAQRCLSVSEDGLRHQAASCLQGFLDHLEEGRWIEVLKRVGARLSPEERIRLLLLAPFQSSTWRLLDPQNEDDVQAYWERVIPECRRHTPEAMAELINAFLRAERPRAAFFAVHLDFDEVTAEQLTALLEAIATSHSEEPAHYGISQYNLSRAFESLSGRDGVGSETVARLEFLFAEGLQNARYGTPTLDKELANSPALFAEMVTWVYRRQDGAEDAPEWAIEDPERREALARKAHHILTQMAALPGSRSDGSIDDERLTAWLKEVRCLCRTAGRAEVGDNHLGALLAKAPAGDDGVWPSEEVCRAMEQVASTELGNGFDIAVCNAREAQWGEGGDREREVAAKYRVWAERRRNTFPFVGSVLEDIARSYDQMAQWWDDRLAVRNRVES